MKWTNLLVIDDLHVKWAKKGSNENGDDRVSVEQAQGSLRLSAVVSDLVARCGPALISNRLRVDSMPTQCPTQVSWSSGA